MRAANVFQLEVGAALAGGRRLVLRFGLPMLLGLPFVLAHMPAGARATGLVMLVLFTSFFGAAVAVVRRRSEGVEERLRLLPIPRGIVLGDQLLASAAVDVLQMGPVLALFVAVNGHAVGWGEAVGAAGLFAVVAVLLNLLGMLLAGRMRSNPEVHLTGALAVGVIAFLSGLFPVSARLAPMVGAVAAWSPVAWLASALKGLAQGQGTSGAGATAAGAAFLALMALLCLARGVDWPEALCAGDVDKDGAVG